MTTTIDHFINGRRDDGGTRLGDVFDPANGCVRAQVRLGDRVTVLRAVTAAQDALPAWRNMLPLKRARILGRFKDLLMAHSQHICELTTQEHGKTLADSMGELQRGIENVEFACSTPELLKGEHSRNVGPEIDIWSEFQPLGVVAGITPYNFPVMVPLWMWPAALACGNTFILKPSERDPSAAAFMAELALEAGVPPGVLNVVNGDKEAVDTLLEDPRVKAISFVGSTPVAEAVYRNGTAHGKRVQAFGGAKNHAVVMPDADLDNVVTTLMGAAYGSTGQRCMAISLVVAVGDAVADALVAGLKAEVEKMKVGPGTSSESDMAPLATRAHLNRVHEFLEQGIAAGARLVVDGRGLQVAGHKDGYFLGPCLFDHVTPVMSIYKEEIFGPVLGIVRVGKLEQAMRLIDEHEYGNGTCIFTRDGESARYFTDNIQVGMVGVNVPVPVPAASHSFGGWKRSMFGDLHAYGPDAVRFYTKRKAITQRWPSSQERESVTFSFPSNR